MANGKGVAYDLSGREGSAGTLPDEIYDSGLSWWRAGARRFLVRRVEAESFWIASIQEYVRRPWLDSYFVYTSSLGTHTFFMAALPMFYFFGHFEIGNGVIFVLSAGVYAASFFKDLFCVPRPYTPPVTRLSIGSHHLEYGFPSSHTTNSISVALYSLLLLLNSPAAAIPYIFIPCCVLIATYAFSIVFGRIYCGMHSFVDCLAGAMLGSAITLFYWNFGPFLEGYIAQQGWGGPVITIAVWMLLLNQFPQPVDDCPCFEDAIAFVSVEAGILLSLWHARHLGIDKASGFFTAKMLGAGGNGPNDWAIWTLIATLKMLLGVIAVFSFRLVAKPTLQSVLPPIFRFLAQIITLPNRRWYTPATEYRTVPLEHLNGLSAIPSVIDLPTALATSHEANHSLVRMAASEGLKRRRGDGSGEKAFPKGTASHTTTAANEPETSTVRHYDADVLTRAVVYSGIAILVAEVIPVCFEFAGWGL